MGDSGIVVVVVPEEVDVLLSSFRFVVVGLRCGFEEGLLVCLVVLVEDICCLRWFVGCGFVM